LLTQVFLSLLCVGSREEWEPFPFLIQSKRPVPSPFWTFSDETSDTEPFCSQVSRKFRSHRPTPSGRISFKVRTNIPDPASPSVGVFALVWVFTPVLPPTSLLTSRAILDECKRVSFGILPFSLCSLSLASLAPPRPVKFHKPLLVVILGRSYRT